MERRITRQRYTFVCRHDYILGRSPQSKDGSEWPETGGLIIELSPDEYLVAGSGIVITFEDSGEDCVQAGIGYMDEVEVRNGEIHPVRRLNGDQTRRTGICAFPPGSGRRNVSGFTDMKNDKPI